MKLNDKTLVAVLRPNPSGLGTKLLLPYDTLDNAAAYMRQHHLSKAAEKHFEDNNLVQWFVQ